MKRYAVSYILLFFIIPLFGQIQVKPSDDTNFTPIDLINNIFLGEGVQILNIKYEGDSKSVGYFSNGIGAVNIDRGIIMTTGESSVASLPNNSGGTQTVSSGQKYFDQELSDAINSSQLYDICKFEITFIPFSDSIRFNYVFASEEYPEFICSQYNDAFGFFISGANPAGGDYAGKNIALVPGTSEPVSINNVHPYKDAGCQAKNEEYYNTNPFGSPTMTYDAYLDVFSAAAKVVPCTEYKIKLVIADVVDDVYDSAVFLEAKSFSTNALKVALNTPSYDATISEGCSSAELVFGFDQIVDSDYDLELRLITDTNLGNIATENIDFSPIPVDAKILKGNSSFSFDMQAYIDNIDEGQELIALEYRKNVCSLDTLFLHIIDNNLATINLEDSTLICQDDTVNVGATLPDDFVAPPDEYYYNHNKYIISGDANSQISSNIKVSGFSDQILSSGILKEICIDTFVTRVLSDYDFYIVTPDNRYFELSTDNGFKVNSSVDIDSMLNTCFKPQATVNINNGNPIVGNYFPQNPTYTGDFMPEGNWDDLWGAQIEGNWQLLVVNDEQGWAGQLDSWHIAFNSNYKLSYNWSPNLDISCIDCLSPDIFPDKSRYYYVDYQDTYGCSSKDSIYAKMIEYEVVGFLTCDSISVDYIKFKWGANKQGETYEIKINGKDPWIEVNDTFYEVSGLGFDQSVQIEVRIKSDICINSSLTANCTTYPCPPPDIQISSIKNVTCAGDKNGFIQLVAAGTKPPYSFRYKNSFNNTGYFDNLGKGIDTIYVTDSDSCTIPFIFEISGPDPITNNIDVESIDCHGANNGSITVLTTGGNGGFQYFWERQSDGATFQGSSLTGLGKSQYLLTVTDSENCEVFDTVTIDEPDEINISASIEDVECKGYSTGAIFPTVTGGVGEYNYNWNTPTGDILTKDIVNAIAGTYYLTITDQNNCTKDTVFYILEPDNGLNVDIASKDTLCFNEKDAWISLKIPESKNYQIIWNTGQISDSIYNLTPGRYSVTVTDSIGCQSI
ncbi:MAG TPA: hypothetical protein ENK91_08950, partial [Bacteroidetes bacterium]|nr:hypothetical protein [Bacteroidota bacterium]